jgi:hypothetical protein
MVRSLCSLAVITFLNVCLVFAQSSTGGRAAAPQNYSFSVHASLVWLDTNIDLRPGDRVHISGAVIACGAPVPPEKDVLPLPTAPVGALLAKIQPEATPVVATPDAEFPIIEPSHLYLGVNGSRCTGSIPAKVQVERHATKTSNP